MVRRALRFWRTSLIVNNSRLGHLCCCHHAGPEAPLCKGDVHFFLAASRHCGARSAEIRTESSSLLHRLPESSVSVNKDSEVRPRASRLLECYCSFEMTIGKHRIWTSLVICGFVIVFVCLFAAEAGRFLIIDKPQHSDLIVILGTDFNDFRVERGLTLLRQGYARQLILDAPNWTKYGRNQVDAANDYLLRAAPDQLGRVHVCRISDSTQQEIAQLGSCIRSVAPRATSGLLVTTDIITRRTLSTARVMLPQLQWSIAAAQASKVDQQWWQNRERAKNVFIEWQGLLWWEIVGRWTPNGTR